MKLMKSIFALVVFGLSLLFFSCDMSPPAAPPGSNLKPQYILKFVPYTTDGAVYGYFSLADSATNQVASDGSLKLTVYSTLGLSVGDQGSQMRMKHVLYEHSFDVSSTNFHWESYGSVLSVQDLALKFKIPYENFRITPKTGQSATIEMEFRPAGITNVFIRNRRIILY